MREALLKDKKMVGVLGREAVELWRSVNTVCLPTFPTVFHELLQNLMCHCFVLGALLELHSILANKVTDFTFKQYH